MAPCIEHHFTWDLYFAKSAESTVKFWKIHEKFLERIAHVTIKKSPYIGKPSLYRKEGFFLKKNGWWCQEKKSGPKG